MLPFYDEALVDLNADDIAGIQTLYGTASADVASALIVDVGGGTILGSRGSLTFESRDVIGLIATPSGGTDYRIYFDGSDAGLDFGTQINAITSLSSSELLMSFATPTTVNGITFTPSDVARFTFANSPGGLLSTGENTAGTFDLYLDGSDVDLEPLAIDGLAVDDGDLLMTFVTSGGFVSGVGLTPSDVVRFTGTFGFNTTGTFSLEFDGSDVGLDGPAEAIDALGGGGATLSISTAGTFTVPGLIGGGSDIAAFNFTGSGPFTTGAFNPVLVIDASDFNLNLLDVTGYEAGSFAFPPTPAPPPPRPPAVVPGPGIFPIPPPPQSPIAPNSPFGPAGGVNPNFPTYPAGFPGPQAPGPGIGGPPFPGGTGPIAAAAPSVPVILPTAPPAAAPPAVTPPKLAPPTVAPPAAAPPVVTPPATVPRPITPIGPSRPATAAVPPLPVVPVTPPTPPAVTASSTVGRRENGRLSRAERIAAKREARREARRQRQLRKQQIRAERRARRAARRAEVLARRQARREARLQKQLAARQPTSAFGNADLNAVFSRARGIDF